jgi:small subunit ribosomal protein S17
MSNKILNKKNGIVVSDKMDKTVIVTVDRIKEHPIYKKKFTLSKRYKADDPNNEYKVGDKVSIISTRPLSREKHYKVTGKI